jgi:hypothetical protein
VHGSRARLLGAGARVTVERRSGYLKRSATMRESRARRDWRKSLTMQSASMPRGGSKPGERRGGRARGTPNKLSIGRAKAAVAAAAPGLDALDHMRIIAQYFLDQAAAAKPSTKVEHDLLDRAARVLRDILPYERPKLTTVRVGGDPDAPPINLSVLSDSELAFLRRTRLKMEAAAHRASPGDLRNREARVSKRGAR